MLNYASIGSYYMEGMCICFGYEQFTCSHSPKQISSSEDNKFLLLKFFRKTMDQNQKKYS
jgi:hypothetical protein